MADLSLLAEPTRLAIVPWLLVFFIIGASSSGSLAARRRRAAGLQRIGPLHSTRQISSWQKPTMHPAFKPSSSSAGGQSTNPCTRPSYLSSGATTLITITKSCLFLYCRLTWSPSAMPSSGVLATRLDAGTEPLIDVPNLSRLSNSGYLTMRHLFAVSAFGERLTLGGHELYHVEPSALRAVTDAPPILTRSPRRRGRAASARPQGRAPWRFTSSAPILCCAMAAKASSM